MNKRSIFENVQFLNEGLFDKFNTIELYGIYIGYDPSSHGQVTEIQGCKTLKELGILFFNKFYKYKNGKYIIDHIDKIPDTAIVKVKAKKCDIHLLNTPAGKIECYISSNIIDSEVLQDLDSIRQLADFCDVDIKIEGPDKERKQAIRIAQDILKHQSKIDKKWINNNAFRRIDGYVDLDTEIEGFCNGFKDTCWLLGIDANRLNTNNIKDLDEFNKIIDAASIICEEIDERLKEHRIKKYISKLECYKYDLYILIATPETELQWTFTRID